MAVIITLVVFILLILVIVWGHFLAPQKATTVDQSIRDQTNKDLYIEHKNEIERDYQQGKIDEENYQYLLAELDKSLLQDMEENQQQSISAALEHKQSTSFIWPSAISVFILIFSFVVYQKLGAFEQLQQPQVNQSQNQHANLDAAQQQAIARLEQLKKEVAAEPNNSNLWYALGQELVALGDFDNAMTAFDKTIEIEGEAADLLGAKAQAAYYKNGQQITAEVQGLIDRSLALDPSDASTNILLGMHAFGLGIYQEAIDYWQGVLDAEKSVNVAALTQAINEAKNRLNPGASSAQAPVKPAIENNGVGIELTVSLSTEIENYSLRLQKLRRDKTSHFVLCYRSYHLYHNY